MVDDGLGPMEVGYGLWGLEKPRRGIKLSWYTTLYRC